MDTPRIYDITIITKLFIVYTHISVQGFLLRTFLRRGKERSLWEEAKEWNAENMKNTYSLHFCLRELNITGSS